MNRRKELVLPLPVFSLAPLSTVRGPPLYLPQAVDKLEASVLSRTSEEACFADRIGIVAGLVGMDYSMLKGSGNSGHIWLVVVC